MQRLEIKPRPDYARKLENIGLSFHALDNYWNENVCYRFTAAEVDELEAATEDLHKMCLDAVQYVIEHNRFADLGIPPAFWQPIAASFARRDFHLYGRFDFAYDGQSPPKLLEYNADTPTSLLEAAVAQWYWLEEKFPQADQFNSLHEKLVARWKQFGPGIDTIHFASLAENEEDWVCATYLMDTAAQAGFEVRHIFVEDIGWSDERRTFVDLDEQPIAALFKLYPWEFMLREEFGAHVAEARTRFIEPLWKAVLSCKGLLPILWEMYPNHPNLLPAYFEPGKLSSYAKKPLYSREGANIELVENGKTIAHDGGPYGAEGHVYQALCRLKSHDGRYPVVGCWVVHDSAAGMGIREDGQPITTNLSNFVPHYFDKE
ncbi:MAG: gsp [Burkholderiaceae bacterium]|nr:gsp [Burkholderiaceae bacterium]